MSDGYKILSAAAAITTAVAPVVGNFNSYNAASGNLAVTLPALGGLRVGANFEVEKSVSDTTMNTVTFTCAGADTFDDATTAFALTLPGERHLLQVISISGTKYWKIGVGHLPKYGLASITSAYSLTNSSTATTIVTTGLGAAGLAAGCTYQISLNGTVQTQATSGTLTFTPYIQGTALAQTAVMPTQSTNAASAFQLQYMITVRTTGTSGTAIAQPFGVIQFATPAYLTSTSTAATTVNTTSAAASNALYVQGKWATASATNTLTVQTAVIERLV